MPAAAVEGAEGHGRVRGKMWPEKRFRSAKGRTNWRRSTSEVGCMKRLKPVNIDVLIDTQLNCLAVFAQRRNAIIISSHSGRATP